MEATRTCVCGVPGLSTITSRAFVVSGAPSAGRGAVPRGHDPKALSASVRSSATDMSPATTSAALFGTKCCFQNASIPSRVIVLFEDSVPSSV